MPKAKKEEKKEEFETEDKGAESVAAASVITQIAPQEQENIVGNMNPPVAAEEPKAAGQEQASAMTSDADGERESNIKVDASNPFNAILNTQKKESRSHKTSFLLTENNFQRLSKLSEEAGASKNELINRLIESCYQNSGLS